MRPQLLGNTNLSITRIGFGAFKIGRNEGIKYPTQYDLPDDATVERFLNGVLDAGIRYIDTAPAYGLSEERIGNALAHRRNEFVLSTKVGETFDRGISRYDFSADAVRSSIERSLRRLKTDVLDLVLVHSNGDDLQILHQTDVVETLMDLRKRGDVKAIGFSGKTMAGAQAALEWSDAIMVEYHLNDQSHAAVIAEAADKSVGVIVKKGLAAGHLAPEQAIRFVLSNPNVDSIVIGGLNLDHLVANIRVADALGPVGG